MAVQEYSVSQLSALIKRSVEQNFSDVCLKAEVSALKEHSSGHLYFSLKDSEALINAVCWKWTAQKQKIRLEDGMEIKCFGSVSTYPMQSKYQFIVKQFELAGAGELLKILEERKKKLAAEGYFDLEKKKPIPTLPRRIGVITSPTGAVIQDIRHRISQRFPRPILLWPVLVQGLDACRQIVEAIDGMNALTDDLRPDVLIVARGGGSFEDLMPFNEEEIVKAVARSVIPIISAVGHETDTTLIDYAADVRAPTPTAAAEFAVPERIKLQMNLDKTFSNLRMHVMNSIERKKLFLGSAKILNIRGIISEKAQTADYIFEKVRTICERKLSEGKVKLAGLVFQKPVLKERENNVQNLFYHINIVFFSRISGIKSSFEAISSRLESNSYVKILRKGFAFVKTADDAPITSAREAKEHEVFGLVFSDGEVQVRAVEKQGNFDNQEAKIVEPKAAKVLNVKRDMQGVLKKKNAIDSQMNLI